MSDNDLLIELDGPRAVATDAPEPVREIEIDLVDPSRGCRVCGQRVALDATGRCRTCYAQDNASIANRLAANGLIDDPKAMTDMLNAHDEAEHSLNAIAAQSAANARPRLTREYVSPSSRGADDAVDSGANDGAIAAMRRRAEEQRNRDAARRAAETELAARAQREGSIVAVEETARPLLKHGDLVAGAVAEGHGVIVGWRGQEDMTRATLVSTLERNGLPIAWAPDAASAKAQASRALVEALDGGYTIKAEKKSQRQVPEAQNYDARWTVGSINHGGAVGDRFGEIIIVATLTGEDLVVEGDADLSDKILTEYRARINAERYRSSDVTTWLCKVLREELDAVRFGVGWYVPRKHADTAAKLCDAFSSIPWGTDWIVPALPVATSNQLRAGILRGLSEEVDGVMHQLALERETAKTREEREDIGPKRAQTFLRQLREIGQRVVAYGALLGEDRVATLRETVKDAMGKLESSMGEDDAGLVARFANIWDEIALDRQRNGGTL